MTILLFGVSNVGKSLTGQLLANHLVWYGSVYRDIKYHFNIDNRSSDEVVRSLLTQYNILNM